MFIRSVYFVLDNSIKLDSSLYDCSATRINVAFEVTHILYITGHF